MEPSRFRACEMSVHFPPTGGEENHANRLSASETASARFNGRKPNPLAWFAPGSQARQMRNDFFFASRKIVAYPGDWRPA